VNSGTLSASDPVSASAEKTLAVNGRSFYWARHFLGQTHAARATRLYALCRHLDDLADESSSPESALDNLLTTRNAIRTGVTSDPTLRDGLDLMLECRIPPEIVLELIEGLLSDLDPVRTADEAALLRYSYRVAGTVGIMMCGVLDVHDPLAYPHAMDLGIAMQLTNICRDIAEDAGRNRRYLPATIIGDREPAQLLQPGANLRPLLRGSVSRLLDMADRYYASGESGIAHLPLRARIGILVAARVYRAIGSRLRRRDCDYWSGRVVVGSRQKALVTLSTLLLAPLQRFFWRPSSKHDSKLHEALIGMPGTITKT
jgi:phytoene synthase